MQVTRQEIAERLSQLGDEELLLRFCSGNLTELALMLARAELLSRGIHLPAAKSLELPPEELEPLLDPSRGELLTVVNFSAPTEAHVFRALLISEGIPAYVIDAHTAQASQQAWNETGFVRVLVPARDWQQAYEVWEAFERGDYAVAEDEDADERRYGEAGSRP